MFHPKGPGFWELAGQALSSTEEGYDLLSPKFDYTPFRTPDLILGPAIGQIKHPLNSAIDLCCGTGAAMTHLHHLCRMRLAGIDMSQGMLARAAVNLAELTGGASIELHQGTVLAMPFVAEFDLAVCFGALGHILDQDQDQFLKQVKQVLVPGGQFLFVTFERPPIFSREFLLSKAFNLGIHVRNLLFPKRFEMYYLRFLLPDIKRKLEQHGFQVRVLEDVYQGRASSLRVILATSP